MTHKICWYFIIISKNLFGSRLSLYLHVRRLENKESHNRYKHTRKRSHTQHLMCFFLFCRSSINKEFYFYFIAQTTQYIVEII